MFRIKMITDTSTYLKKYFLQTRVTVKHRPAIDDIDCFLACDPTGLYAGELNGQPIGTASVFKYDDGYRHGGGYYTEKDYRKRGYGLQLFNHVVKECKPITNISTYAPSLEVVEMYKKYFGSGEILYSVETHDMNSITALKKLQGISMDATYHVKQVSDVDFEALFNYDKLTFGYDRKQFLYKWLYSSASRSCVALNNEGSVVGYVVARESMVPDEGYKIGPLFCEDIDVGKVLIQAVLQQINEQGRSNSVLICCPIGRNAQVQELLKFLDSTSIYKHMFMTTNGQPKGCVDKWFAVTSIHCG